ncbi:MAG TPA: Ig-like domain-containing protein [Chitinophagaceae bacterium]|jgi:hypothetical protein
MKKLSFIFLALIILISSISVISNVGCAVIIPPTGGLRDTLPPVLVKASPPDSSKNFKETHITLSFDEYVQLDNVRENLIVSPLPQKDPEVSSKLKTITIRLRDSLKPNTTYTLNFGRAVKDVNEGNIARNFSYLFATGSRFDSLTISGRVVLAESGKIDTTLTVMLHQHGDDSAVVNEKPRYIARLDSLGNFTFRHLPADTFYVYALDDQGGGHRYLSEKQLFAFADSAVIVPGNNKPIILYAYGEKSAAQKTPSRSSSLPGISVRPRGGNNSEKRLRLQTNISNNQLDLLSNLEISFEQPLKNLDTSLIHFSQDTTFTPVVGYQLLTDSTNKELTLQYKWKENTLYHLVLEKTFAVDTLGRGLLKTDTLSFKTKKLTDYGSLILRFRGYDPSLNPVLEFIQNDNVIKSIPLISARVDQAIFLPGDYDLRILQDRNKNGKWDPGEFFGKRIQPEIVKPVKRKITVKADWDNEFDIQL